MWISEIALYIAALETGRLRIRQSSAPATWAREPVGAGRPPTRIHHACHMRQDAPDEGPGALRSSPLPSEHAPQLPRSLARCETALWYEAVIPCARCDCLLAGGEGTRNNAEADLCVVPSPAKLHDVVREPEPRNVRRPQERTQ